jgi:hypothetical protein
MAWDGLDATDPTAVATPLATGNTPYRNRAALVSAYAQAAYEGRPLLIPAGEYEIHLPKSGDPVVELTVPIIGAGASVTTLKFTVGTSKGRGEAYAVGDRYVAFRTLPTADEREARIEGLELIGPDFDDLEEDGSDAPDCWAVYVADQTRLAMLDVRTTRWNQAIRIDGMSVGASAYLRRCEIKSRGTRIYHLGSGDSSYTHGLTLVDCTIGQDSDGFRGSSPSFPGVHQVGSANLRVIGGRSLGSRVGNDAADFYSVSDASDAPPREIALSDHYFAPEGYVGLHLAPAAGAVQVANCVFAGRNGIILGGGTTVMYQVSNCAFVGGRASPIYRIPEGKGAKPEVVGFAYAGSAVYSIDDVAAYFSNCRFGAALSEAGPMPNSIWPANGYESILVRRGAAEQTTWCFSNCYFGGLRSEGGTLFHAAGGRNIFQDCHFHDEREDAKPQYCIHQTRGAIELHRCFKEGRNPLYFAPPLFEADEFLAVLLENCVLRRNSVLVKPLGRITVSGRGNHFGEHVDLVDRYDRELVSSDLELKRGRGQRRVAEVWQPHHFYVERDMVRSGDAPERVYECTSSGRSGLDAPTGTGSAIDGGGATWTYIREDADYEYDRETYTLTLSWNADWVEIDENVTPVIAHINMRCGSPGSDRANRLSGGTIQLLAVQTFKLTFGGNVGAMPSTTTYLSGQVATLRYSPLIDRWVTS